MLRSSPGERVVFVPNPGNAGDALINLGAYEFLRANGIDWEPGHPDRTYPGRIVVFSGGGGMVELYRGSDLFFRRNHPVCKELVLMPHTVRGYADMISAMDARCHLFAREAQTLSFLREHVRGAHVHSGHDMAFFLSDATIAAQKWDWTFLSRPEIRRSWSKMVMKILFSLKMRDHVLHVLRRDEEATAVDIPTNNFDLSALFSSGHMFKEPQGHMSPGICASTIKTLRLLIRSAQRVETNRLHVTVLSAIVGTPVAMLDNNYGKNRGIYEHSIRDYFPNVAFVPAP